MSLLYDLSKVLNEVKKLNIYHSNINDETIVYSTDTNLYKLKGF